MMLLGGVALLYRPALSGPFLFDDFSNFLRNPDMLAYVAGTEPLSEVLAHGTAGPLGRPLAQLSLAWQFQAHGPLAEPFKQFNLLVHLVNTLLVWMFARQLLAIGGLGRSQIWALFAAALWALHPLALTPVLYVVQRMTSLSTLGVLVALIAALAGRARLAGGQAAGIWLYGLFPLGALFALLSKESGALLPAYLLVLEFTVLAAFPLPAPAQWPWRRFLWLCAGIPTLLAALASPWWLRVVLHGYQAREFTLVERLWTEARVVCLYLRMLIIPTITGMGLYHDDLALSTGWLQPASTLAAVAGLCALAWAALWWRRRAPWFAFGVAIFLSSQLLESTVVPLELMHEHRVYFGMLGPLLALAVGIGRHAEAAREAGRVPKAASAAAATILLALAILTGQRAADWSNPLTLAQLEAAHHPASVRAQYDLAQVYDVLASRASDPADRHRLLGLATASAQRAIAAAPGDSKPWVAILIICAQVDAGCQAPVGAWSRLAAALRAHPRAHLMVADVQALAECELEGACQFPFGATRASIVALQNNRVLPAADREFLDEIDRHLAARALTAPGNAAQPGLP